MSAERRLKSACASDKSLRCPHEETLHAWLSNMGQVKILIRRVNPQADRNRRWTHMSEGTYSDVTIHSMVFCKRTETTLIRLRVYAGTYSADKKAGNLRCSQDTRVRDSSIFIKAVFATRNNMQ